MLAAAPLLLMAVMCLATSMLRSGEMISITWVVILVNALTTGLCVLVIVLMGWRRGMCQLKHGGIPAALVLASIDVLIPTTLAVLLWSLQWHFEKTSKRFIM